MKLQHKAWALILIVVGVSAVSAMLGARYIVGESFDRLEQERAQREGERARRVLLQQHQALVANARDYSYWIDTVRLLAGTQPGFMWENFDAESLGYLRISEVLVYDSKGLVHATVAAAGEDELGEVSPERAADLRPLAMSVVASGDLKQVLRTFRHVDGQLELVVAAAIHDPDDAGARIRGVMVMVRLFDAEELARLADVLMTPTRLSFNEVDHGGEDIHVVALDADHDELHAVLRDHRDQPVAALVLTLDRQLQQKAQALTWQGMALVGLAGLVASVLLVWLLNRLILQRLQRLHGDVQRITLQGPVLASPLQPQGNDELTRLEEGINTLLDRVRQEVQAQQEAHAQHESLQLQLMQSQKTEALGRLTGGIAHDFNNSLAAITGWVRLASEDLQDLDHPSHEALQQALKAIRYADGLMRQLLAFGRQSPPKFRRMHWSNLIDETRQLVTAGLLKRCEVTVDYQVDDDEVDADPTQMQQVLVNLLINASDAMQGEGLISLVLDAVELPVLPGLELLPGAAALEPGRYLRLQVQDHGPGIKAEDLDRIFDPFFSTKGKGRGTGLGLAVVQGIVARHGGAVGVTSVLGEGATFILYLPVTRSSVSVPPVTQPGGWQGQGRTVLFVDDDQSVRHAWSALLERKGWQVTRARDGEEAWSQFTQTGKRWDVVLTDQSMPRLDGVGLALRIRQTESPPPIVLMSGHVNEVPPEQLERLFVAVLHKPVDAQELEQALENALARDQ